MKKMKVKRVSKLSNDSLPNAIISNYKEQSKNRNE